MKYKQIIFLTLIAILSFNKIFSNISIDSANSDIITGDINLNNKSYKKNLIVYGNLNFSNLIVNNQLSIYGKLSGKNLKASNVNISGSINASEVESDSITINGNIIADNLESKNIIVNGLIEANNIKILDNAIFNGETILENSALNNCELNIKISSNEASSFKNTTIKAKFNNYYDSPQF
ncbi:MAG: polymer-forming cytoskeletal protein [Rickettsiales bacterium]